MREYLLTKPGPYHIETFLIGSCICDPTGYNVLSFPAKLGAKFTSYERCVAILKETSV